ncbi:HDOD domain-containing protein [Magnetococcales bacterium HHB-1]
MNSLDHLVHSITKLASPPDMYHRVEKKIQDPTSSLDDIGEIIMEDPGLCARLLRIANSAFFALAQPVTTITHALAMVGMKQLRDLVLATTIIHQFTKKQHKTLNITHFWHHAIACGLAARVIATYRREKNVEALYVAGLLHDIGRLALLENASSLVEKMIQKSQDEKIPLHLIEIEALGFSHAEVGGAILKAWKLPERLYTPVQWHHTPNQAKTLKIETAIIHISDLIAHSILLGVSGDPFMAPLHASAWERINLPANLLPEIARQVELQFEETAFIFSEEAS